MEFGFSTTCCPDARQVVGYLPEVRPSWFFSVPRIYEKLKSAIEAGVAHEQDEQKKQATQWAIDVGLKKVRAEQAGEEVSDELAQEYAKADELVLSKIRERLGLDQLEALNVGAAPTPREVIEFFHALGLPLAELWGMSETCGAGCCNRPDHIKIGTVGPPAPGTEIKLDEDGEVLIKAGYVMKGYRNLPDKTKETMTDDGFLRTGDIGEFDEDGFLKIVDRKKELIINAAGKNMSPANIEAKVKTSSQLIGQAICDRRRAALQRRADHARPRRRAGLRRAERDRGRLTRVARVEREGASRRSRPASTGPTRSSRAWSRSRSSRSCPPTGSRAATS